MFFMRTVGSCPTLDESFPFMLPGWRAESTLGGFIMSVVEWKTATDPGEGFATWISSNVRPQDPGEGHRRWASPGG